MKINTLLQHTGMWRASSIDPDNHKGIPTGFEVLDRHLAGGGWPADGIAEFMYDQPGIGELRLLAPALARLSKTRARWLLWVAPPWIPYAPALAHAGVDLDWVLVVKPRSRTDILWVLEKALASRSCSAVLAWPGELRNKEVRRLQVAGREGHCLGVLFRPGRAEREASPAELRIRLYAMPTTNFSEHSSLRLRILKRRGGWATEPLDIDFDDKLNQVMPDFSEMQVKPGQPHEHQPGFINNPSPEQFTRELERPE